MQFKHPEILYALCLLLIPILVHLFQLRRFKKEDFTNVAFLKEVTLQTRKSSQLKKWLTLLTRLLLLTCIILAFAQPFTSRVNTFNTVPETVVYIDNSFSMQAKGEQGELLKRAVQELMDAFDADETISIVTNDNTYKNTTLKAVQNDLLQLKYSPNQLRYDAAYIKSKQLFSKKTNAVKNLIFISDFQQKNDALTIDNDSLINTYMVQLKPINIANISIDSIYISKTTASNTTLKVNLKSNSTAVDNVPVALYSDEKLLAKTSVTVNEDTSAEFSITEDHIAKGTVTIDDTSLQFDNQFFFNIDKPDIINVLAITEQTDSFLKRIFGSDEFNYTETKLDQLNYSSIDSQNLIVLNALESIPSPLANSLQTYINKGGYVIVIPSKTLSIPTYNAFLSANGLDLQALNTSEKRVTTIHFAHPIFENVFDKQVTNFQYPKVNSFFSLASSSNISPLQYEDGQAFLSQNNTVYMFSAALDSENSNFINSPLIVPTFYNIARQSLKTPQLYYTIGNETSFDVSETLQQDAIVTLKMDSISIIPQQQYFNNKISITTNESPEIAGVYNILKGSNVIKNVSYNYNRSESQLNYHDMSLLSTFSVSNSLTDLFDTLKSDSKVNELWKWFVIFALAFIIIEMLILKYFK